MIEVSVIIPIHNCGGELLRTCIESICAQTMSKDELELILVDDASTDDSGDVCDEYADAFEWITAVHPSNHTGCASTPRNEGFKLARGEYVFFADSDDWLGRDCLRRLLHYAQEHESDFVLGRVIEVNRSTASGWVAWCRGKTREFRGEDPATTWEYYASAGPWSRLVKRDLLVDNNIEFREDVFYYEDFLWNIEVLHHAKNPCIANDYDYYFFRRDRGRDSMTRNRRLTFNKQPENLYRVVDRTVGTLEEYGYDDSHIVWKKVFMYEVRSILNHIRNAGNIEPDTYPDDGEEWRQKVWQRVRDHYGAWARMNLPLDLVCLFDAIEHGLGPNYDKDPINYFAGVKAPAVRENEAIDSASACDVSNLDVPEYLSHEARQRLVAKQASSCEFYGSIDASGPIATVAGEYAMPVKATGDMAISMHLKGRQGGEALEFEMTPYVWGEDYQERGIWHVELPDANLASVEDLEFEIAFQGEVLSRADVLPWDDDLGRPLRVDKTLVKLRKANSTIAEQKKAIAKQEKAIAKQEKTIEKMKNSRSWRYTKVLRRLSGHE